MAALPADGRDLAGRAADFAARYALLEEVGRGASGVVHRARRRADGATVAVKVVRAGALDGAALARCAHEAATVARLHHPNIVRHHELCVTPDGGLALVMEYVEGETLRAVLRAMPRLSCETVVMVLRDVARALEHAHARGVVHRDVKPENIFLDPALGRALLADFDAAVACAWREADGDGAVTGTPRYMAPEQIAGGTADARSDLYSLAIVGWEMLTGYRPWGDGGLDAVIYRQRHADLAPVSALRPDVPRSLALALDAALEKHLDFRLASASEFLAQLGSDVPVGRAAPLRSFVRQPARPTAPLGAELAPTVDPEAATLTFRPPTAASDGAGPVGAARPATRRRRLATAGGALVLAGSTAAVLGSGAAGGGARLVVEQRAGRVDRAATDVGALAGRNGAARARDLAGRARAAYAAASASGDSGARTQTLHEAVALLDSAAAASPQDPDIYLLRARATLALGELRRSWSDAELAARLGRPWQGAAVAVLADARVRGPGGARAAAGALLERATAPGAALTADEAAHVALALEGVGRATDAAAMAARVPGAAAALERLRGERPASPAP